MRFITASIFCSTRQFTAAAAPATKKIPMVAASSVTAGTLHGVANVAFNVPLALAAAHNAGAAALLVALVVLNFFAFREHTSSSP